MRQHVDDGARLCAVQDDVPVFAYSYFDQNGRTACVFFAAMGAGALLGMPVVPVVVRRFGALQVAAAGFVLASIPKLLLGILCLR